MKHTYYIKNRYGMEYAFIHEDGEWFIDLSNSSFLRQGASEDNVHAPAWIDPEGGPFICIDSKLCDYRDDLPNESITKIEFIDDRKLWKLHTNHKE